MECPQGRNHYHMNYKNGDFDLLQFHGMDRKSYSLQFGWKKSLKETYSGLISISLVTNDRDDQQCWDKVFSVYFF